MSIGTFSILVFNKNTLENPIYEALEVSGFGRGFDVTVEDAVAECCKRIRNLAEVCNSTNIPFNLKSKEEWMKTKNAIEYGYFGWDDPDVIWKDIPYEEIMK